MMKKLAIVIAAATLATGCATVEKVALDPGIATSMKGKTVVRTTRAAKPDFVAMTPTKAAFGMVGALSAISAGNELIKENNIAVPADAIGQRLGEQLQGVRGMQFAAMPLTVTSEEAAQIATAASGTADYVLDVQTKGWMLSYFPTSWGRYRVIHTAHARMIDVANKKVVAQGVCARNPENAEGAPTYDDLVNNQAAGLKNELTLAATECTTILQHEVLAL